MMRYAEDINTRGDHIEHDERRLAVLEVHPLPNHVDVVAYSTISGALETVRFERHELVEVFH